MHVVGANVAYFKVSNKVVYLGISSYAEYTKLAAELKANLFERISLDVTTAGFRTGLTLQCLIKKT